MIDDNARKRLARAIRQDGMIGTLVWNEQTGNIVSGHQRLSILDSLERNKNYALVVTVINVDERKEKALNVQMNNLSMQGEWDLDLLSNMALADGISFNEMGFSEADAQILFGGDSRLADLFEDVEDVKKAKETLAGIKESRSKSKEETLEKRKRDNADYMVTVICETADDKIELCNLLGIPDYEQFVRREVLLRRLGKAAV